MKWPVKIGSFLSASLVLVPLQAWAESWSVVTRGINETAIVFSASDIRDRNLPARIHHRNVPPVFANQVVLACLGIPAQPQDLLVYLPASKRCMRYEQLPRATQDLSSAVSAPVSTFQDPTSFSGRAESGDALILNPASDIGITAGVCVCPIDPPPTNKAPVASVQSGSPQEASAGATISQISFYATDADDTSISHTFAYTLNDGIALAGLPPGLTESCVAGSGTLACDVNGTAPAQVGIYQIKFTASDGKASDLAIATLTVTGQNPEDILLQDGFEPAP